MNFSLSVKEELIAGAPHALCCKRAYARGLFFDAAATPRGKLVLKVSGACAREECARVYRALYHDAALMDGDRLYFASEKLFHDLTAAPPAFSCPSCASHFLRGVMISCGSVTDPEKAYRLEIRFADADNLPFLQETLASIGYLGSVRTVGERTVLYFRNSAVIEDLLVTVGAQQAMFALVNAKMTRELRNATNRATNCEARNIVRSVGASGSVCAVIAELRATGRFLLLPPELRVTAELRARYPDASLAELASLHTPPITKSGLNHRLTKILEFSKAQ